jgi:maltooligosyltrehalose synthase
VYPLAAETHGYDTVDHFEIDPRLGDQALVPAHSWVILGR